MYSAAEVHADISLYAAEFKKEWESFSEEDEKAILARRRLLTMGFSSSSSIHSLDAHIYGVLDKRIFDWYQERFPNSTFLKVDDFTTLLQKYNLVCNRHTCYRGEVSENTMDELEHLKGIFLIPIGCYRVIEKKTIKTGYKEYTTQFMILGTESWNLLEIISIYIFRLSTLIIFIFSIISIVAFIGLISEYI